jgi:Uma2 family endonuclease
MSTRTPAYVVDPADPRAPSQAEWDAMSAAERDAIVGALPPSPEPLRAIPPEGDRHRTAKTKATDALDRYFARAGRRVYVSSELATYYPAEPVFAPDVLAVDDVDPHPRSSWVVSREGKGLDFVLEVHDRGREAKDAADNVERYARLGVSEYFLFDLARSRLLGYRLAEPGARVYSRLVPQHGVLPSRVLGLGLALEGERVRFYVGDAPLPDAEELIVRLDAMLRHETERLLAEAEERAAAAEEARAVEAQARAAAEERAATEARARAAAEAELAALKARLAELERKG